MAEILELVVIGRRPWPAGHLQAVAEGRDPGDPDAGDPVLAELAGIKDVIGSTGRQARPRGPGSVP